MATQTGQLEIREDPFLKKTAQIRQELETRFKEYHLSLDKRKQELCTKLDTAESEYKKNQLEHKQKLCAIEQIQANIKQQTESFKAIEDSMLAEVNKQKLLIEQDFSEKGIELLLDTEFSEKIQNLGTLKIDLLPEQVESSQTPVYETLPPQVKKTKRIPPQMEVRQKEHIPQDPLSSRDYTEITQPILTAVKQGDRDCDLKFPQRVAVHYVTGKIYIADQTSHCVKVYNQQGQYLSRIGQLNIDKELVHPYGVCLYKNNLYITSLMAQTPSQYIQSFIFKFHIDIDGPTYQYSTSCGVHGSLESVFKKLTVINADQKNGDIYVCDEGCKIHVLDKDLNYKRLLDVSMRSISDFQVKDNFLFIVFSGSVFVVEKYNGTLRRRFSPYQGCKNDQLCIDKDSFFIITKNNNIDIIEEIRKNSIYLSDQRYEKFKNLKTITINPKIPADDGGMEVRGITTDLKTQKIIVVLYSQDNMLQIY